MREPALPPSEIKSSPLGLVLPWSDRQPILYLPTSKEWRSLICRLRRVLINICLLTILGSLTFIAKADPLEVIVNPDVPQESLSKNALRGIFGMRLRTWQDGTLIRVFVLNDQSPVHVRFAKKTLNIYPHQLRRAWDRLVYSGTGQAPIEVLSAKEMRGKVASTPGAIGYLPKEMINDNVKVVEIE